MITLNGPLYLDQFPDFELGVTIPPGWIDTSYRNDVCPSFQVGRFQIWVDYIEPDRREMEEWPRFAITRLDSDEQWVEDIMASDDFEAIKAKIEELIPGLL